MTIEVVEFLQAMQNGFYDFFFNMISFLGEKSVYIFVLGVIYYTYDKKLGEFLSFSLFFSGIFNNILKLLFSAPRPFEKYPDRVTNLRPETSTGHSFPSGHAQNFSTFLFAGAFWSKKRIVFVAASLLSILMALSRMYLGVHFLEDVATSIILGIISAFVLFKVFKNVSEYRLHQIYVGILVIALPFVIILGETDLFKSYGLMLGFTLAMMFEKRYVQFSLDVSLIKKGIRIVSGLAVMLSIQIGLGIVFDLFAEEGTILLGILDLIRYGLIALIGLGVFPMLFRKFNF